MPLGPHLGAAWAKWSQKANISEVRLRRWGGAEEERAVTSSDSSQEVALVVGLSGSTQPLQLSQGLLPYGGHLGLMAAQLNEEQSELLRLLEVGGHHKISFSLAGLTTHQTCWINKIHSTFK